MKKVVYTFLSILLAAVSVAVLPPSEGLRFTRITHGPVVSDRASSGGVAWVDYDRDGDLDLFVANGYDVSVASPPPQLNRLYRNDGAGIFVPIKSALDSAGFSSSSTWADVDNDGDDDPFITSANAGESNSLYLSDGAGGFEHMAGAAPSTGKHRSYSATWADADNDGFVDLFVSNGGLSAVESNLLYRNTGAGVFQTIESGAIVTDSVQSTGSTWVDYDLDGDVDLFVPGQANALYRNDGDWSFHRVEDAPFAVEPPLLSMSVGSAWGDYDNDGDFDVYIAYQIGEENRLYRNEGNGRFERIRDALPVLDGGYTVHALWTDFDQDGRLDLLTVNWGSPAVLYRNLGSGRFERAVYGDLGRTTGFGSSAAVADYDSDGDQDIVIGHWPNAPGAGENNLLYRNDGPTGNWLLLDLVGTRSNRSGIGSRVVIHTRSDGEPVQQTREVRSQDGWRSQHAITVHFGLGNATDVERVDIFWPSGQRQTLRHVSANQRMTITEEAR